jgi:hypothetical protein
MERNYTAAINLLHDVNAENLMSTTFNMAGHAKISRAIKYLSDERYKLWKANL